MFLCPRQLSRRVSASFPFRARAGDHGAGRGLRLRKAARAGRDWIERERDPAGRRSRAAGSSKVGPVSGVSGRRRTMTLAVCPAGRGELGVEAAGPAALLGDDHADPEAANGGEVLLHRKGAAAGDDPLFRDARRPAGRERLRGVEDADGERDAGPAGGLRVGGEVPGARGQEDRPADRRRPSPRPRRGRRRNGRASRAFRRRPGEVLRRQRSSSGISTSGRRKTRQGIPRRRAALPAAAWTATA